MFLTTHWASCNDDGETKGGPATFADPPGILNEIGALLGRSAAAASGHQTEPAEAEESEARSLR